MISDYKDDHDDDYSGELQMILLTVTMNYIKQYRILKNHLSVKLTIVQFKSIDCHFMVSILAGDVHPSLLLVSGELSTFN